MHRITTIALPSCLRLLWAGLHLLSILNIVAQQLILILDDSTIVLRPRRESSAARVRSRRQTTTPAADRHIALRAPPQARHQQRRRLHNSPCAGNNRNRHTDKRILSATGARPTTGTSPTNALPQPDLPQSQ